MQLIGIISLFVRKRILALCDDMLIGWCSYPQFFDLMEN